MAKLIKTDNIGKSIFYHLKSYRLRFTIYLILLATILFLVVSYFVFAKKTSETSSQCVITLNECYIYAPRIPYYLTTYVLGTLVSEELYDIIKCESNFQPDVCSYAGCKSGMGLCQIIPSTLKYCEEKLGKKLDPFNPQNNLDCGKWLLENEGNQHWKQSKECWGK